MDKIENIFYRMHNFRCIDDNGYHNFPELKENVYKLKNLFDTNQLREKERIIFLCDNSFYTYVILFAAALTNCILVPISNTIPIKKLITYITTLRARAVIMQDNSVKQEDRQILENYTNLLICAKGNWIYQPAKNEDQTGTKENLPPFLRKEDPALILFTSGTTSEPKAVIFSHSRILGMLEAICSYMMPNKDDVFVIAKKAHHVSSWICEIMLSAFIDATVSLRNSSLLSPRLCLKHAYEDHGTILFVNPFLLKKMTQVNGGNELLKYTHSIYTSGSPLDKTLHQQASEYWHDTRIYNVYGLTEAGPRVFAQGPNTPIAFGSVGLPVKNVSVYFKKQDKLITCPYAIGELYVRTPYRSLGRWASQKPVEKLLRTGDIGYFDEEGNYYIVGRNDELLSCNSYNVNPVAVEEVVTSFPNVETCIVLVDVDANGVDKLIALYTTTDDQIIQEKALYQYIKERLEPHECPREFYKIASPFISATGKLQRSAAKKYFKDVIKKSLYNSNRNTAAPTE